MLDALSAPGSAIALDAVVHNVVVPHYIAAARHCRAAPALFPEMAAGWMIGALAMTEPDTGSDVQAICTWRSAPATTTSLTGAKTSSPTAPPPTSVLVWRPPPTPAARGSGDLAVRGRDEGLRWLPGRAGVAQDGTARVRHGRARTDEVRVPVGHRPGAEGEGFRMLMGQRSERLTVAVTATAAIEHAVDLATRYVNERYAFAPLIAQQHVLPEIAERGRRTPAWRASRRLHPPPGGRRARRRHRVHGQRWFSELRAGRRPMPAALRRLRLHGRVPDLPDVAHHGPPGRNASTAAPTYHEGDRAQPRHPDTAGAVR
ncbi:hypothetical protein HBB16_20100 [Pseudonocardia sp. MCCB 268]|nr:hypothetical protein [Pseudonocardia cytotoxica]